MIILKYHRRVINNDQPAYVSNITLGKIYGIDASSVARLIRKRFDELQNQGMKTRQQRKKECEIPIRKRYGIRFLKPEHVDYLKDDSTLQKWIGRSLKERCVLFHRHFGNFRINPTLLSNFYKLHKIKRKKIKHTKMIDPAKEQEYLKWQMDLNNQIKELKEQHFRIIYLDETIFTSKTIRRMEYTPNRRPLCIP